MGSPKITRSFPTNGTGTYIYLITVDTQPLDNLSNVRQAVEKT